MIKRVLLDKALAYMTENSLPVSTNRLIKVFADLYPAFYKKHEYLLDSRKWHVFSRGTPRTIDACQKELNLKFKRKVLIYGKPKCDHCGADKGVMFEGSVDSSEVANNHRNGLLSGWMKYCCQKCSKNSEACLSARKKTCLAIYGTENVFQNEKIKAKLRKTNIKRYGVDNPNKSKSIIAKRKITMIDKYGEGQPSLVAKRMATNKLRRGVNFPTQDPLVRDKVKATLLKNYGVENPSHSTEIMNRITSSWKKTKSIVVNGKLYEGLQGYEPQALTYIKGVLKAKIYSHPGRMKLDPFKYKNGSKTCHYFPDFKIKYKGKVYYVEVKSFYTAGLKGNQKDGKSSYSDLKRKSRAVIENGGNYMLLVMNDKGKCLLKHEGMVNKEHLLASINL